VSAKRAKDMFEQLAHSGYGAKKSVGHGHFKLDSWKQFNGFDIPTIPTEVGTTNLASTNTVSSTHFSEYNGFISLANWVPARDDPTEGYYELMVKYGKLGEQWAMADKQSKYPLIMLKAGSCFRAAPGRDCYGRLVEGIAPSQPQVVQYGFAFDVELRIGE
jgi:CRISPR/Cas system CSM-associated protein Csm4 (group 5 of RAMP superfamily)